MAGGILESRVPLSRCDLVHNETHALCRKCGQPATYSQLTFEFEERGAVGRAGMYEAVVEPASWHTPTHRRFMRGEENWSDQ